MSQHERHQKQITEGYLKAKGLRTPPPLRQIVLALTEAGKCIEATELLFGCRKDAFICNDALGFDIFRYLRTGENPRMIDILTDNHRWASERSCKGLSIQVYPEEWLVITEPVATQLVMAHL